MSQLEVKSLKIVSSDGLTNDTFIKGDIAAKSYAVNKAGDTMTGSLTLEDSSLNIGNFSQYPSGGSSDLSVFSGSQLRFDNTYGDFAPKIVMYGAPGWLGGFGISNSDVDYFSGINHRWYTGSSTSTHGTERLSVLSDGFVLTPTQPYIFGRISGSGNTYQTMTVQSNRNASVSTANGISNSRFTAQVGGVYSININTIFNSSTGRCDIKIFKNSSVFASSLNDDNGSGFHFRSISINIYLAQYDYIEFFNATSTILYNGGGWDTEWTSFSITLLG